MTYDDFFRYILIAGLVLVLPIGVFFRIRSHTDERLDRRQEGWFILITLRIGGALGILGLIAYVVNPRWMEWSSIRLPIGLRWLGVAVGGTAAGLLIWTFRHLGKNLTDTVVTRRDHTLVESGPYRWVRHPFYVAFALAVVANSLVAANWFLLVVGLGAMLLLLIRTRTEEENLLKRFGDDYRRYMQTTGRFFPRLPGRS